MKIEDIKFKAWDKELKKMYEIMNIDLAAEYAEGKDENDKYMILDDENCELLPFTGFRDKNGEEIYEGDILKQGKSMLQIIYNDNLKQMRMIPLKSSFPDKYKLEDYEIIGNVWENPELLKG